MKIILSGFLNTLAMILIGTIFFLILMLGELTPKPIAKEIPFSQAINNKQSFVDQEVNTVGNDGQIYQLTFVNGVVLYIDKGLYIVSGNPLPDTVTENDYIIVVGNNKSQDLYAGDIISISGPTVSKQSLEQNGTQIDTFYISGFEDLMVTDHIQVNDYHQFTDISNTINDSNQPNLLYSWWLLTSPISPLSGISPLRPVNVYPKYP